MPDAATATMQFGLDTAHATPPATPAFNLPFISETLTAGITFAQNDAKVGRKAEGKQIKTGIKPNGGIDTRLTPEEAGYILGVCLGLENAVTDVGGSVGGKLHEFVPVAWGPGIRMPSFSLIKNNGAFEIQRIISNQIATWGLTLNPQELATFNMTMMGYDEVSNSDTSEFPTFLFDPAILDPVIEPYKTCKALLQIDTVDFGEIDTFSITCDNRLTDRGQGLNGDCRPRDNEVGSRLVTVNFTARLDAASAAMRENKYKAGVQVAMNLKIVSPVEYETGFNYRMEFDIPAAVFTTYDAQVPADGQIVVTATAQAHETPGNEVLYAYHEDMQATKYIP
jgi:hypothetical protein